MLCANEITPVNVSLKNLYKQKKNERGVVLECPECEKRSFKPIFNDYPNWIQSCSCCNYRTVNSIYSPFVFQMTTCSSAMQTTKDSRLAQTV